jgi:catechol 2,3-dioxygenase-like lactoylglutathione lyase family enzyme
MKQRLIHVALVVRDYDEAIQFFCDRLHFRLVEDTPDPARDKRWVLVAPPGSDGPALLLARAANREQEAAIGRQTGGRVFLFLQTDDVWRDFKAMNAAAIKFVRGPTDEPYGIVAVFEDLYGNLWDLIQPKRPQAARATFGRVAPTIPVADIQRALGFYCDVLGFTVSLTNGEPVTFAVIQQGGAQLHLEVQPGKAGSSHAHILVDDLNAVHQRLLRAGATIHQAPQAQEWGLRDIVIADPDGNTFEIAQPIGERTPFEPA